MSTCRIEQSAPLEIRPMTRAEVDLAVEWAAREGWNPGLQDADCFYAADPAGFLIGLIDDVPVAVISAVKYETSFGFIGFYIVHPEYRGRGYGLQIWNRAMERLAGRTIGLDGVVAQQENYRKSGFQFAANNARYHGVGMGDAAGETRSQTADATTIVPLERVAFDELGHYDRAHFPADRTEFLRRWIRQPHSHGVAAVKNGTLASYGVIRPCQLGMKIGPLFAEEAETAERLFCSLVAHVPHGVPYFLDVPTINPDAVRLAEKYELTPVFETARMYAGPAPKLPWSHIYGVTSFELG